jgi:hypothetical protein
MQHRLSLLGGLGLGTGLGAGLMYLLDPDGGRRRRALARDKAIHGMKVGGRSLRKTSVHLGNRTKGLVAKAGSRLRDEVKVKPRAAVLSVGALAGTVGLGLLARNRKVDDLTRPLSGSRTVRGESSAQLEW